jgi:hypothetical protein
MSTFIIESVLGTLWTGNGFNFEAIEMAARTARAMGKTPFLWVSFQKLLNNGVEQPELPFRHDWRFTGGGEARSEIERGHAGMANALAKCMIAKAAQGEGMVNFPCHFGVSCSPDGIDWE